MLSLVLGATVVRGNTWLCAGVCRIAVRCVSEERESALRSSWCRLVWSAGICAGGARRGTESVGAGRQQPEETITPQRC